MSEATSSGQSDSVRFLIENSQVGAIIGKGGSNVSRIRDETGVFLSILKTDIKQVSERIMMMKGDSATVALAVSHVAQNLRDSHTIRNNTADSSSEVGSTSIRVLVHRAACGAIIGKAGATIKETQSECGVRIQISNEPLPNSTDKAVTITGTPSQLQAAMQRILDQLRENPLRPGTKEYQYVPGTPLLAAMNMSALAAALPNVGNSSSYPGLPSSVHPLYAQSLSAVAAGHSLFPPGTAGLGLAGALSGPTTTQKIAIPTVTAGCVIGKMGSTIRDIRMQSQTTISIADPDPNTPGERIVTLTGSQHGIQTAIYLIRNLVEQYEPPTSSTNGSTAGED